MFDIFSKKCGVFSFGELQKLFFLANISSWSYSWPKFSFSLKCLPLNNKALTRQHMKSCPHLVRGLLWVFSVSRSIKSFSVSNQTYWSIFSLKTTITALLWKRNNLWDGQCNNWFKCSLHVSGSEEGNPR
jgi:hypothetical protein